MNRKELRGSLLLLLGSVIWGAAFVAQRVGMDHMGPFTFGGIRMLLAWLVMIPVTILFERKKGNDGGNDGDGNDGDDLFRSRFGNDGDNLFFVPALDPCAKICS